MFWFGLIFVPLSSFLAEPFSYANLKEFYFFTRKWQYLSFTLCMCIINYLEAFSLSCYKEKALLYPSKLIGTIAG